MTTTTEAPTMKHPTLVTALAAFQAHVPTIKKGKTAKVPTKNGGAYSYDYADLSDVTELVLPALAAEGLAWVTWTETDDTLGFALHYALRHESGEEITGVWPLPTNVPPQALGSSITYARRYALTAVTGVAPGGDDDDAMMAPTPQPAARRTPQPRATRAHGHGETPPPPTRTDDQWAQIITLRDELGIDGPTLGQTVAYVTGYTGDPTHLPADAADKVITYLAERAGAVGEQPTLPTGEDGEQK